MSECLSSHPDCKDSLDASVPTLPKRLVKISDGRPLKIQLYEPPEGQTGHYTALSHCWGNQQIITTTCATFAERKDNIPLSALSKTFHDAVDISFRLGIHYLWIDSLCIIQDSTEDWERESSKMQQVYQNAILTLAATASSSGQGGLLIPRPPQAVPPIKMPYSREGRTGTFYI